MSSAVNVEQLAWHVLVPMELLSPARGHLAGESKLCANKAATATGDSDTILK